jgi:hypothetical protein
MDKAMPTGRLETTVDPKANGGRSSMTMAARGEFL